MRVLITGTGTGVGKTWVACALIRALRDLGKQVIAIKPVETGRSGQPSDWEDGVRLAKATGQQQPAQAIIRLPLPGAPVLGGEGVESAIDFDALLLKIERYIDGAEFGLVEGMGGLLTPVTWEWNMTDLARDLGACALVVAEDRLGTINHTLLTLSALELAGIPCAGVVLTTPETTDRSTGVNAAAIARLSGVDRVMAVPRAADPGDAAAPMVQVVGWLGRVAAPA
ncbi:MAG TPA: dethiobiotin synthase [Gemmatimonadales bacterium]|nr:dethiobiotin synthase [Gemmatimonadales bacterium]